MTYISNPMSEGCLPERCVMTAALSHQTPAARKRDLVVTAVTDEVVVYDVTSSKLHTLNPTAAFVWQQCDGQASIADIAHRFTQTYGLDDSIDVVWSALEQLDRERLLQTPLERPAWVAGITRRDLMKRVAIGALVALPLVRSLAAPTAAHAQSGTTTGNPTTTGTTIAPCAGRYWHPRG